jgi:hypothetical protein
VESALGDERWGEMAGPRDLPHIGVLEGDILVELIWSGDLAHVHLSVKLGTVYDPVPWLHFMHKAVELTRRVDDVTLRLARKVRSDGDLECVAGRSQFVEIPDLMPPNTDAALFATVGIAFQPAHVYTPHRHFDRIASS